MTAGRGRSDEEMVGTQEREDGHLVTDRRRARCGGGAGGR